MSESELNGLTSEQENPETRELDLLPTEEMLGAINGEDQKVAAAVGEVIPAIAKAVDAIADRLRAGGRLHYFGAGTSGRLGVLDASECPPTFGVEPSLVQAHIAGGEMALRRAVEGAEDYAAQGWSDVRTHVRSGDSVVAIAASGRTPYCLGVLAAARQREALTIALVCNRPSPMHEAADITIDPVVGPEVLSGSTRLKSGTAQKMALNMISTGVMVRLGKTYGNLMVGLRATNKKLRVRAARLVREVTENDEGVEQVLESCGWDVRTACVVLASGLSPGDARDLLERKGGSLRAALGGSR